jgi:hypothetical protein
MPSEWNLFVKKIYHEGKNKNPNYEFKQALKDASKRKSEMGHNKSNVHNKSSNHNKSSKRRNKSRSLALAGGKTRRRRHRR